MDKEKRYSALYLDMFEKCLKLDSSNHAVKAFSSRYLGKDLDKVLSESGGCALTNDLEAYITALQQMEDDGLDAYGGIDLLTETYPDRKREFQIIQQIMRYSPFTTDALNFEVIGRKVEARKPIESIDDPIENLRVQVVVTESGKDYYADFITTEYVKGIMDATNNTNELAGGAYYPGQHRIVVRDLSFSTVRRTLEELITNNEMQFYFKKI